MRTCCFEELREGCKDLPPGYSRTGLISGHSTKVAGRSVALKVQRMLAGKDKPPISYAPGNPFVSFSTPVASKFF